MAETHSTMAPIGLELPLFTLPDVLGGGAVSDTDFEDAPGVLVMFLCNHCPFVRHLRSALGTFGREYLDRDLAIIAINSNDASAYPQDGPAGMREEARAGGYTFPYLFDETQEVARAFQAACTPDFFLFDADRILVYRGQFDSSRPSNGVPISGEDLRAAADAVLEGRAPEGTQYPSVGCNIKWAPGNQPDYI